MTARILALILLTIFLNGNTGLGDPKKTPAIELKGDLTKCEYISSHDGKKIEYALWYPDGYDATKKWPLIVFLHGSGENKNWKSPTVPRASVPVLGSRCDIPFLVAFPLMRGSWAISGLAERDVIDTIDDVCKRASVDRDRIHLTGLSLGAFASWSIATHAPHLFASLSVFAGGGNPETVINLRNIPIRVYHGDADQNVKIGESIRMVNALKEAKIGVDYFPFPGVKHNCWKGTYAGKELYDWMYSLKRVTDPRRISFRTETLRHNTAYWATIEEMVDPGKPAIIDIFCPAPDTLLVHTDNVARLTLEPPASLIPAGTNTSYFINNSPAAPEERVGKLVFSIVPSEAEGLIKKHGLSGPIQDVYLKKFAIVPPSSDDPKIQALWEQVAKKAMSWRSNMTFESFRFINDKDVTPEMLKSTSLICFGDRENNSVLNKLHSNLPITLQNGQLSCNGSVSPHEVAAMVMIYPNPLSEDQYVLVCNGNPVAVAGLAYRALCPPYLSSPAVEDILIATNDGKLLTTDSTADEAKTNQSMAKSPSPKGLLFGRNWELPPQTLELLLPSGD